MNFQELNKIEDADFYISQALKRSRESADERRNDLKNRDMGAMDKSRKIELARINSVKISLCSNLMNIVKSYPNLDSLTEFYQELIKITLDYNGVKKSLGAVNWSVERLNVLLKDYSGRIRQAKNVHKIPQIVKEFLGRAFSVVRQIKRNLIYLEHSRKTMKGYPTIKSNIPSIAIAGFPNVGKSTLLRKLTPAKPKIGVYSFTTQSIMLGYMEVQHHKIQVLDTPGTLNRLEKMNDVEKQAYLAMKHVADAIVYVFDLTEPYSVEEQLKLYKKLREFRKPMIVYLSKTDVVDEKKIREFAKEHANLNPVSDAEVLKKEVLDRVK